MAEGRAVDAGDIVRCTDLKQSEWKG
ncbi:hypothetical protein C370_02160 [Cryptococcus neoformans A1-35-8]|nr:hypothetical protein C370_02160 [Cryptococcus neoformans var. grubii A1-35-8]